MKGAEEIEEDGGGENNAIKKNKKGDEVMIDADGRVESEVECKAKEKENEEKVVKEPQELDGGEEEAENEVEWVLMGSEEVAEEEKGNVKDAKRFNKNKEGQNEDEMEGNLNGEVEEDEKNEVLEGEEMQEEQEEGKHEEEREVKDEKEENEEWEDEQVKDEDDGDEEHPAEQFSEQMRRTEDDNENPESKAQDDDRVKDSDSVESMSTEDSDSMLCENICYNSERIKDEEQYAETKTMQNLDEQIWRYGNPILGAWTLQERNDGEDSEKTDEKERVGEFWETQEEEFQDDHKGLQDEESTDDEEAEHAMEDEDSDDEDVKIYSKDHYPTDIFHTLTQFKDLFLLTDLTLSTKEGTNFHAHSPVLAAVSSLIWGNLNRSNRGKDNASVGVHRWSVSLDPPVDYVGLQAVVEFAYTGMISCLNKDTVEQIKTTAQTLGIPRVLMLCNEEEEKSTKTGGKKKGERISAAEQMMISLQSIKQLWMDKVGCDVILEALGESLHGE